MKLYFRVVQILNKVAKNIPVDPQKKAKELNTTNLLLQAMDITKDTYHGKTFGVTGQGSFSDSLEDTKTSVKLPATLLNKANQTEIRIGFIYFANNKLFHEKTGQESNGTTSQVVLSSSVYGVDTANLHDPVVLKFPRQKETRVTNKSCVFWNEQGL